MHEYLAYVRNLFSYVLILCGLLSLGIYPVFHADFVHLYVGVTLVAVALVNGFLEYYQKFRSEELLKGFLELVPRRCTVRRAGQLVEIAAADVVVGDLLYFASGDKIAADCRVVYASGLHVDMSSLTGESEPQERDAHVDAASGPLDAKCLGLSGTTVASGEGIGIVTRTGGATAIGRIAQEAKDAPDVASQMTGEMDRNVRLLVLCGAVASVALVSTTFALGFGLANAVEVAIGALLCFLPQGLPATITISLTVAAKRLAARHVLVKNLRGIETLGTITALASDKTGTLTMNRMRAVALWLAGEPSGPRAADEVDCARAAALLEVCAICSNVKVLSEATGEVLGDATEQGIHRWLHETLQYAPATRMQRLGEIPFTSQSKWHVVWAQPAEGGADGDEDVRIYLKGAPERVLAKCRHVDAFRGDFERVYREMAGNGWRVLAFASKRCASAAVAAETDAECAGFVFHGLLALQDPPKPGVVDTVARLRQAGIQVLMVTGDHPWTAASIARQVGIVRKPAVLDPTLLANRQHSIVIHGDYLASFTEDTWLRILRDTDEVVFARAQPQQKLLIVKRFQEYGHVVGASGDGVNDAPTLRIADLGISMNETAADVTKYAADIIILDDDFNTILVGVLEGRLVFENLKKSLRYTLTHILPELAALATAAVIGLPLPLSAILILVFDVFCEPAPAMSYAVEPAPIDLLKLEPRLKKQVGAGAGSATVSPVLEYFGLGRRYGERLIDAELVLWCFFQGGVIIAAGCFGAYILSMILAGVPLHALYHASSRYFELNIGVATVPLTLTTGAVIGGEAQAAILARAQSAYFLSLICGQMFNLFLTKHRYRYPHGRDLFVNKFTYLGMGLSIGIGTLVVFVPPLQVVFETAPIYALAIAPPFASGFLLILYEYVRRYVRFNGIVGRPPKGRELMKRK